MPNSTFCTRKLVLIVFVPNSAVEMSKINILHPLGLYEEWANFHFHTAIKFTILED